MKDTIFGGQIPQKLSHMILAMSFIPGVIILPTQTMHYYTGNPSKLPYIVLFHPPPMGNFHHPCIPSPNRKKTGPGPRF